MQAGVHLDALFLEGRIQVCEGLLYIQRRTERIGSVLTCQREQDARPPHDEGVPEANCRRRLDLRNVPQ